MRQTIASFALLVIATVAPCAGDQEEKPDFSKYPKTREFRAYFSIHIDASAEFKKKNLLVISAFPMGSYALEYFVNENGAEHDHRHLFDFAMEATHRKQLSEADMKSLRSAIQELPGKSTSPPLERLVVVSFRDGANWRTRTYDSAALPKAMRRIYVIIGERNESK